MFNTVYPDSIFTLENFFQQGQARDDLAARLLVPEHGGSWQSLWIPPSPDLILMLVCKLENLTAGHELYEKLVACSWPYCMACPFPCGTPSAAYNEGFGPKADASSSQPR